MSIWDKISKNYNDTVVTDIDSKELVDSENNDSDMKVFDIMKFMFSKTGKTKLLDTKVEKFISNRFMLNAMNPLGGNIYNPIGLFMPVISDKGGATQQALTRLISNVVQGGLFESTDGKTFTSVLDNDSQQLFYDDVEKARERMGTVGYLSEFNKFTQAINGKKARSFANRSIIAQALFYNKDSINAPYRGENGGTAIDFSNYTPSGRDNKLLLIYGFQFILRNFGTGKLNAMRRSISNNTSNQNYLINFNASANSYIDDDIYKQNKYLKSLFDNYSQKTVNKNQWHPYNKGGERIAGTSSNKVSDKVTGLRNMTEKEYNKFIKNPLTSNNVQSLNEISTIKEQKDVYINKLASSEITTDEFSKKIYTADDRTMEGATQAHSIAKPSNLVSNKTIEALQYKANDTPNNIDDYYKKNVTQSNRIDGVSKLKSERNAGLSSEVQQDEYGVPFSFTDVRTKKTVHFIPTVESFTDDFQITFADGGQYIGRVENIPSYDRTQRSISFSFTIYSPTYQDYLMNKKKIDFLKSLSYPIADSGYKKIQNPFVRFTFSNDYQNVGCMINSLGFTYDNNTTMDILDKTKTGFRIIKVSLAMQIIHDKQPILAENFYTNIDSTGELFFSKFKVK